MIPRTVVGAVLLTGILATGLAAQTPEPAGNPKMGAEMMEKCRAMMAKNLEWEAEVQAMEAKLDRLLGTMNAAKGNDKVDAMAAVVQSLVAQQKAVRQKCTGMHAEAMQHMMLHATAGASSMAMCPMMGAKEASAGDEHSKHH